MKWAALLNVSLESARIRLRFIPKCTTRKTVRKRPASDIIIFFPMEEVRIVLIKNGLIPKVCKIVIDIQANLPA
jgi:hypothetical protein